MKTDTGIRFNGVSLTELTFMLNKKFSSSSKGIPVEIDFETKNSFGQDKKVLSHVLSVVLFQKTKNRPFVMKVSMEGTFSGNDHKELLKFSKVHAPAHLFPFVREIIGNITMRANIPPLLLPPVNLQALASRKMK